MRKWLSHGSVAALLLGLAVHAWGQGAGNAKAVIDKAIVAHGGAKNLELLRRTRVQGKGSAFIMDREVPFTSDAYQDLPDRSRTVLTLTLKGVPVTVIQVQNGDKVWTSVSREVKEADEQEAAQVRFTQYTALVQMLTPLIQDKNFTLTSLGESNVKGKPALGINVAYPGKKDVQLYFDKDTFLLVKMTRRGTIRSARRRWSGRNFTATSGNSTASSSRRSCSSTWPARSSWMRRRSKSPSRRGSTIRPSPDQSKP